MADTLEILVALQTSKAVDSFNGMVSKFSGKNFAAIGGAMTAGLTVPIIAGLGYATGEAIKFNSAIQSSARTLNLSKEEATALSKEVLALAPSLGLLPEEFANVAAEAGKLGVAKNEVAAFGKVLANLSTITDVPIQEFTKKAGAIKTIFQQNTDAFEKFGAAVNALDDQIGGTTPNILEFTARVGAVGKAIGLSAGEVAAFGAVFETVGIAPERAGTAFQNFANQLFTIDAATPKARKAFESMGYSAATFGQTMRADPTGSLIEFLNRLNSIPDPVQRSNLLIKIFGKSSSAEIAALASQTEKLSSAFKMAGDDTANLAKMQNEVANKMSDPAVQAKVLQAQFNAISIQIGAVLVPMMSQLLKVITPLTQQFSAFLTQNPEWAKFFVIALGGVAVLGPLITAIGAVISAVTSIAGAVGGAVTALAGMSGIAGTLGAILTGVGAAIAAVGSALVSVPVLITAAIAAIVALVLNLGGCRDLLVGLGAYLAGPLMAGLNLAKNAFMVLAQAVINNFKAIASSIPGVMQSALSSTMGAVQSIAGWIVERFKSAVAQAVEAVKGAIPQFMNAGGSLMQAFGQGVANSAAAAYNAVSNAVKSVRNLLPSSPAKEGPLKDLDKSGAALLGTFAANVNGEALLSKLTAILDSIPLSQPSQGLGAPAPTLATAAVGAAPTPSGNQQVVINYTQNVEVNSSMSGNEIISALKGAQGQFLDYLSRSEFFKNRKQS